MTEKCQRTYQKKNVIAVPQKRQHKIENLVTWRHNEVCNSLALTKTQAFTYYPVHEKPLIYSSNYGTEKKDSHYQHHKKAVRPRCDIHIRHLWQCQTDTIINVRVMNTYTEIYILHPLENIMEIQYK